ncbi:hypothetical protein ACQP1P_38810 [Dactylosporangium sp. CA-052675]|uniref:hypothetical protein n=1 Tax=Dactylosporangium sp. CA-052675 TaxID=3239927 RepID=UPI003D8AA848
MTEQHRKPVRLAHAVLQAAVEQDLGKAERLLHRLNAECPGPGLGDALVAWCDALAEHANDGMPEFGKVRVLDINQETGAQLTELTPTQRWANRMIVARAAGDRRAFEALLAEVNAIGDGRERGRYVVELVLAVAGTIRLFPRGYARMGGVS